MNKKNNSKSMLINSIKVLVSPWESGFTCGIIMDSKTKMTTEQYELCSTIARGMIKMATTDPHSTFLWGLRGFADDKKKEGLFFSGLHTFNCGIYFDAHEIWEELWSEYYLEDRDFIQGLIQLAVCFVHLQNNNINGARSLINKSIKLLPMKPRPPVTTILFI